MSSEELREYIEAFYRNARKNAYAGQLQKEFQSLLATFYSNPPLHECIFYHTVELSRDEIHQGAWDLRGREKAYLGYVDVAGQSVLEFGTATGYIGYYMESMGAEVVSFDLPFRTPPEIIPLPTTDIAAREFEGSNVTEHLHKSWWYVHEKLNSRNKAVYGDMYELPDDLGEYDVSTFGCILLHLSNPFAALQQAAKRTRKALIVTDVIPDLPHDWGQALMEFHPGDQATKLTTWWAISPHALARMLKTLGFTEISVHYHLQKGRPLQTPDAHFTDHALFTIVGERPGIELPRHEPDPTEVDAMKLEIASRFPALRLAEGSPEEMGVAKFRITSLESEIAAIRSSTSWRITRPARRVGDLLKKILR